LSDFYAELTSRNWAFISPEQQQRIRSTRILLAGCGLGSAIAVMAAQTGFTHFVVADHDVVEISNLNRQAFDRSHVGTNKAVALKAVLEARTEEVTVEAIPSAITPATAAEFVSRADIIVNTVDFDETTHALNAEARRAGKPVVFPMNMGWGGFCLVFTPESATLEDMLGPGPVSSDAEFIGRLMRGARHFELPDYLARRLGELDDIVSAPGLPAPQLAIAAARSTSLVVEALTRLTLGAPVRVAPSPMHLDAWDGWEPAS
jgi:molybdopterin-synthase adenylyltransferase